MKRKAKVKRRKSTRVKEPRFIEQLDLSPGTTIEPRELFEELSLAYAAHVWVYTCVRVISTNFASVPIVPRIRKADGSWIDNVNHQLFDLLQNPNPYMSGYNLREYTAAALELEGNAYWFLERLKTNEIKEIWPLVPGAVRAVASKTKLIDHFIYRVNGGEIRMEYDEVIHYKYMNPNSFIYGQGAMTAAKNTVTTDIFAQIWNKSFFQNSARPDAVLSSDNTLNDGVRKRIMESWKEMYRGPKKHGKTAILDSGLKYNAVTPSIKDMDFVSLKKEMRTEILASFGVPPALVGLLEFANYSNMEQQVKTFWNNTIKPRIVSYQEMLTMRAAQITFDFNTSFRPDFSDVEALRPDEKAKADTAQVYINVGVPLNAVIDALNLPFEHVEGGDVPRAPVPAAPVTPLALAHQRMDFLNKQREKEETENSIRELEWKVFDAEMIKEEKKFIPLLKGFFKEQKERVLKRLEENIELIFGSKEFEPVNWWKNFAHLRSEAKTLEDTINIVFDLDGEIAAMEGTVEPVIRGTYFNFATRMARRIDPGFDFNLDDKFALAWINDKKSKLALQASNVTRESITQEIVNTVEEAVASGFSEGETIAQIKTRIDGVYNFADRSRAERIARTEVLSASNAGNQDAMQKTGVEEKEWLSSRDDKVRPTHTSMDKQSVAIDQDFLSPSGATLRFPGDPQGGPDEIINCRCTMVAKKGE